MARYSGLIGFSGQPVETSPGVFKTQYIEHHMVGADLSQTYNAQNGSTINDNMTVSNRISIVADQFTFENSSNIKYASYMGNLWKVSEITIQRPRIILSLSDFFIHGKKDIINVK